MKRQGSVARGLTALIAAAALMGVVAGMAAAATQAKAPPAKAKPKAAKGTTFSKASCSTLLPDSTIQSLLGFAPTQPAYPVLYAKENGLFCSWTVGTQRQAVMLNIYPGSTRSIIDQAYQVFLRETPSLTSPGVPGTGLPQTPCAPPQYVTGIGNYAVWNAPGIGWQGSLGVLSGTTYFGLAVGGSTNTANATLAQEEAVVRHLIAAMK